MDSWRRATALPFQPASTAPSLNVVVPSYARSSSPAFVHRDGTSFVTLSPDRPHPTLEALRRDELARAEYEEARRTYSTVLQRERMELDTAKHEADALRYENGTVKRDLMDAQAQAAAARRDRDLANATLSADTATLRAENHRFQNEAQALRAEMGALHTAHTTSLSERAQLEMMISNLRAELVAVGRQVVEQNSTIRLMTSNMSRSDPYHLVKERREQNDPAGLVQSLRDELADARAKLHDAIEERNRVKADVKTLEEDLAKLRKQERDTASLLDSTRDNASRLAAAATERDVAVKHAKESAAQVDRLTSELKASKILADAEIKKAQDLQQSVDSYKKGADAPKPEPLKTVPAVPEAERKRYEDEIAALHKQCLESKAKADRQVGTLDDLKMQLKAAHATLSRVERGLALPPLNTAQLINVELGVVCCNGLLERDVSHAGLQDPFVVVVDSLEETVLKTAPVNDTCDPKYNPDVDVATLRLTRGSTAPVRLEVWMLGVNNQNKFLGCASLSAKSLLDGGVGNRTIELAPREKENDDEIIRNRTKLGSITVRVKCVAAGATNAPAAAPNAPSGSNAPLPTQAQPPVAAVSAAATAAPPTPPVVAPPAPVAPVVAPPAVVPPARAQPKAVGPQDVIFYISSCEGLLDRDSFGGKSDPYVKVVRQAKEEFKTSALSGTSDPKWPSSDKSSKTLVVDPNDANPFVLEVWDDDSPASDQFLGLATLTSADILSGSGPRRLQLKPRPDEKDEDILKYKEKLGFVTVQLTILADAARRGEISVEKKPTAGGAPAPPPPVPTAPPSAEKIEAASTGPAQRILVQVVSCAGLMTRTFSATDPYVIVHDTTGAEALVTPNIPKNPNPVWDAATASKELVIAPSAVSFLTFDVLDNQGPFASKYLGFAKISANEVLAIGDGKRTLTLVPRDNETESEVKEAKSLGTITLQFSRIYSAPPGTGVAATPAASATPGAPAAASRPAPVVEELREVILTVCSVKDVLARNSFPFKGSDVYVRILGVDMSKKHQTLTRSNTTTATWDDVEGTVKILLSPSQAADGITFEAWDAFAAGSDKFLGMVRVPVPQLFAMHGETKTISLGPREKETDDDIKKAAQENKLGSLVLKVSVSGQSSKKMSSMVVQTVGAPIGAPSQAQPFGIKVWVKGCTSLLNRQVNGEISDPFVKIRSPSGEEHRTKTVDNILSPTWDEVQGSMRFTLNPQDKLGMISFTVSDVGTNTGLRPMGFAQIAVRDLISDGFGCKVMKLGLEEKENDPDLIRQKDQLGTITVEIVPENASVAAGPVVAVRPTAPGTAQSSAPAAFTIQVLSASKLVKRQRPPCALVEARDSANNVLFKSVVAAENLNPVWVSLPSLGGASGQSVLTAADSGDITFWLYDERPEGRTPLGVAKIPVRTVCAAPTGQWELAVGVSEKENDAFLIANRNVLGSLMVSAQQVAVTAPAPAAAPQPAPPAAAPAPPPPAPRKLRVTVKSGKKLMKKDTFTSDPLVRIFRNDAQLFQSKTKGSTLNPEWTDAIVEVEALPTTTDNLIFRVLDEDGMRSYTYEEMGEAKVPLADVLSKPGERELALVHDGKEGGSLIVLFELA